VNLENHKFLRKKDKILSYLPIFLRLNWKRADVDAVILTLKSSNMTPNDKKLVQCMKKYGKLLNMMKTV